MRETDEAVVRVQAETSKEGKDMHIHIYTSMCMHIYIYVCMCAG